MAFDDPNEPEALERGKRGATDIGIINLISSLLIKIIAASPPVNYPLSKLRLEVLVENLTNIKNDNAKWIANYSPIDISIDP